MQKFLQDSEESLNVQEKVVRRHKIFVLRRRAGARQNNDLRRGCGSYICPSHGRGRSSPLPGMRPRPLLEQAPLPLLGCGYDIPLDNIATPPSPWDEAAACHRATPWLARRTRRRRRSNQADSTIDNHILYLRYPILAPPSLLVRSHVPLLLSSPSPGPPDAMSMD